jgi:calcineurin-like phosphoesterase family protein
LVNTYFMADPHIEHEGVLEMSNRPFASIEEHNEVLMDATNRRVQKHDRLFILGDYAWHSEASWFNKIRCQNVHLIIGNHDRLRAAKLFKTVNETLLLKMPTPGGEKVKVWLSHYPHAYWPASHHGSFHLYGHCHIQREETLDMLFPGRRSMDVGVDNYLEYFGVYAPWSWQEAYRALASRPGHDDIDFYKQFQERQRQDTYRPSREQILRWTQNLGPDPRCD